MVRDITIGQYYPQDSLIHDLDPRVKILSTLLYLISVFFIRNIASFILATAFLGAVIILSRIPFRLMLKGMRAIFAILIITFLITLFWTPGEEVARLGFLSITKEGLRTALLITVRLSYLVIGASIMTLSTTPNRLTDGMESLLSFLKVFRVPVHEIAMMMSIALRFIPILMEELDRIMKAQRARGADFYNKNILLRIKNMVPILVPLFISAMRRAGDLARAMDARCYLGSAGRTRMKPLKYEAKDLAAYIITAVYFAAVIYLAYHPIAHL